VLRYRDLLQVEDLFRRAKAILRTRPIYHSSDAAIRGHVFCSFLALTLQKELTDLCQRHGLTIEWTDRRRGRACRSRSGSGADSAGRRNCRSAPCHASELLGEPRDDRLPLTTPSAPGCSANTENRCRNLLE
jgi:hypothetical protein